MAENPSQDEREAASGDSGLVDSFDVSIKTASSGEVSPGPKQKKAKHRHGSWVVQFRDFEVPDVDWVYYKSECLPLYKLHAMYEKLAVGHAFRLIGKQKPGFRPWLELRDRARKDLYWLGKECIATPESGSGFTDSVHREMCDQFVKKNFDGVYGREATLDSVRQHMYKQERVREVLMLCPTGAYKSTANKIDAAQWMLNFPDVRVFIMTGSGKLSNKFLKEVKGFFSKHERKHHTFFQCLFPEYVIPESEAETLTPYTCPARLFAQPGTPTLWVNSIDGAIAGWHCDVWKGDDIVNEENSNNEETREKLKDRYDNLSQNRPDEWAFIDHLGTRYYPDDWYGSRIEDFRKYPDTNALKYLCRSAWTVKTQFLHVPIKQLQAHMVDLYFPEKMTFASLMAKCRRNEKTFRCQQLNEPAGSELGVQFTQMEIESHTIILNAVPRPAAGNRRLAIIWDTAHDSKVTSDYSAGAVGYCHDATRALYVLEVDHGKWKDSETAIHVVDLHWKWNPLFTEIEKFHGWELFTAEVQRVSLGKYGKYLPLVWRDSTTESGAKRNRVKGLEILMSNDRLWFVEGDWMETLTQQFVKFTGFSKRRKDDIPDAISGLQRLIPAEQQYVAETQETPEQRKMREAQELKDKFAANQHDSAYRTVFQTPAFTPPEPTPEPVYADPGPERMFGGNGMHL